MDLNEYKEYFEACVLENSEWSLEPILSRFLKPDVSANIYFTDAIVEANIPEDFRLALMEFVLYASSMRPFVLSPKAFDYVANNCDEQMNNVIEKFKREQETWQKAINAPPEQQHMYFNHMGLTNPQAEIYLFSAYLLSNVTEEQRVFAKMKWNMFSIK